MKISPMAPTAKGRQPCLPSSRRLVRRPTPAKVSRKAQRDRFAKLASCGLAKNPSVANSEIKRNPRTNFGNFLQGSGLVADCMRFAARRPVKSIAEHDEANQRVARCFGQDGYLAGGVGIERAGGGGLCGVVDGQTRPQAVGLVAQMQRVADERKSEKRNGPQSENGGDGVGGVFIVGVDRRLGCDDG